jgi:imidazole glycerol-phosphate synthase subunit HisH
LRPHRGSGSQDVARPAGRTVGRGLVVADYGMGNRRSVEKALEHAGVRATHTADLDELAGADGLVLIGVGAFAAAMERLTETGIADVLVDRARAGVPVLGLCLGMQLLFERSEELGGAEGLGLLEGEVRRLAPDPPTLKVPHIGWNEVRFARPSPLLAGLGDRAAFYHVHSLAVHPAHDEDVLGVGDYGGRFPSIVARDHLFGVQFHPEKSSGAGLRLLANFAALCARATV